MCKNSASNLEAYQSAVDLRKDIELWSVSDFFEWSLGLEVLCYYSAQLRAWTLARLGHGLRLYSYALASNTARILHMKITFQNWHSECTNSSDMFVFLFCFFLFSAFFFQFFFMFWGFCSFFWEYVQWLLVHSDWSWCMYSLQ